MTDERLKRQAIGIIGALVLQYLLGMYTNMFIPFPENATDGQLWAFAWHQIPLALHIIIGFGLLFGSSSLIMHAFKLKQKKWILASSVGFISILISTLTGSSFISSQLDIFSYIMAVGFLGAILAYVWGLSNSK